MFDKVKIKNNTKNFIIKLPQAAIDEIIYNAINIDYKIGERTREGLLTNKDFITIDKSDFILDEYFYNSISCNIKPGSKILTKYKCHEYDKDEIYKNTIEDIVSKYICDKTYNYELVFNCIKNFLLKQRIVSEIKDDCIIINLNRK